MRQRSKWAALRYLILIVLALSCAAFSLRAQSPSNQSDDEDDEDVKQPPSLNLNAVFDENGKAEVYLFSFDIRSTSSEVKALLEASLGCTMNERSRIQAGGISFHGSCVPSFARNAALREVRIATAPLRQFAQAHKIEQLTLMVRLPDVEVTETQPEIVTRDLSVGKLTPALQRLSQLNRAYFWKMDSAIPEFVIVRFGVAQKTVKRAGAILLGVLLLPLLLIYWMGRKALNSEAQDKAAVWFTYMRYLQWTLNLNLVGWWIAADSLHLAQLLKFFSAGTVVAFAWNYPVTPVIVDWLPPAIVWILCFALSHPVQEKLRGLTWTRRELAMQAFYSCCVSLLPFALFLTGITTMAAGSFRIGLLWMVCAFAVFIIAIRARQKFLGMQPQALTTGDLRDGAFTMARELGVKLQQVYVIPSGKGQMANAFARHGNVISFTDFLLQRMSRREVNYVLGHEMTHLKLGHPGKLAVAAMVSYFVALTAVNFAAPFLHLNFMMRYAFIIAIVMLVPYFWSRCFEYAADAGAVDITKDPEAAISALFKLAQLNMLPIHWSKWSEKWLTHPSSLRRAHAIARKAGIPIERVTEIAQVAVPADDHYSLPATVVPGAKVHSTQHKQGGSLRSAYLMLAVLIFTPAGFALLAARPFWSSPLRTVLYAAGFAATVGLYYVFANFVSPMGLRKQVALLKAKLTKEGVLADSWNGVFVGFSPSAAPRSYELNVNWDLGCLFVGSDRLCYWGEETKFALRSDEITALKLAPGSPSLLSPWRIYVAWKDEERATCGVFNIGCINGRSTLRLRRQTSSLAQQLEALSKSKATPRSMPAPLATLTSPQIGAVTFDRTMQKGKGQRVFKELFLTAIFATIGAALCGLPFHFFQYLFSSLNQPLGRVTQISSLGAGWYVVAVALMVRFIAMIPALRYKDQAVVTVAVPPAASPGNSAPPPPNPQPDPQKKESEPILTR